jgi:hypothetical protein
MKNISRKVLVFLVIVFWGTTNTQAQSVADCLEQLSLDYQKLAGLKSVLQQMYHGYEVLDKGYNSVKEVSSGNFNLHKAFLDGLLQVSPALRKYPRVADIISDQASVLSECHTAFTSIRQSGNCSPGELDYITGVYDHLIAMSLKNITNLSVVMTDKQMRMSDAERLTIIDHIYADCRSQLNFLRSFNNQTYKIVSKRFNDSMDRQAIQRLYGIN